MVNLDKQTRAAWQLVNTWTDQELHQDQQQDFMTWAEAVQLVGGLIQDYKHQADASRFKVAALDQAFAILVAGSVGSNDQRRATKCES